MPVLPSVTRIVPQNPATKQASKQSAHPFYVAIEVFCERKKNRAGKTHQKRKANKTEKKKWGLGCLKTMYGATDSHTVVKSCFDIIGRFKRCSADLVYSSNAAAVVVIMWFVVAKFLPLDKMGELSELSAPSPCDFALEAWVEVEVWLQDSLAWFSPLEFCWFVGIAMTWRCAACCRLRRAFPIRPTDGFAITVSG